MCFFVSRHGECEFLLFGLARVLFQTGGNNHIRLEEVRHEKTGKTSHENCGY